MISSTFSIHSQDNATSLIRDLTVIIENITSAKIPDATTDLIETGLLDSLALVSLIMELEQVYGLTIDFDELELESFRSVNTLCSMVMSLCAESV